MSDRFTWMHSGQVGAPQMNGASGSNGQLLQVLDGCLIDGYNPKTVATATKTTTTVTLTFGISHGYELLQLIEVSGATDAALNGQHRVISNTANTITIDAVGVVVTTGTIATKVAPLGFESIFGSADPLRRAYRSNEDRSTKTVLFLDMNLPTGHGYNATNPAKRAMVSLCEDMTTLGVQINSYTNAENNYAVNPNGKFLWHQARDRAKNTSITSTSAGGWVLVGNGSVFYLFNEWRVYGSAGAPLRDFFAFGDADGLDGSAVGNNCFWIGVVSDNDNLVIPYASVGAAVGGNPTVANQVKGFMIKDHNGIGTLNPLVTSVDGTTSGFLSGSYGDVSNFPDPTTQKALGFPVHLLTPKSLRATLPNLLAIPQNLNNNYATLDKKTSDGSLIVAVSTNATASSVGFYAVDLRG